MENINKSITDSIKKYNLTLRLLGGEDTKDIVEEAIHNQKLRSSKIYGKLQKEALTKQRKEFIKLVEEEVGTAFISVFGLAMGLAIDTWDDKRCKIFNKKCVEIRDSLLKEIKGKA